MGGTIGRGHLAQPTNACSPGGKGIVLQHSQPMLADLVGGTRGRSPSAQPTNACSPGGRDNRAWSLNTTNKCSLTWWEG